MCKKLICLANLVLLLALASEVCAQTYPGKIGVGAGIVWVDLAKDYRYTKADGSDLTSGDVDASGWPTCDAQYIYDGRPVAEWGGSIDDPEQYRVDMSGTYSCSFNGQATLTRAEGPYTIANQVYNSGTNTTTFNIIIGAPGPQHGLIVLKFTDTKRTSGSATNTGFTNLKVIRPGYPLDTTQLFDTPYLDCLNSASFAALRGCGSAYCINGTYPAVREWSDRRKTTDAGQSGDIPGHMKDGAAWEYVVQFVNTVHKDAWIHVPVDATDNYVTQLATLLKNNLDADRTLYVEYDNEVWNWGFPQSLWNLAAANAAGLSYITQYAKRTVEISNLFKNVWGASAINTRVRVVLCWQIGWWPPDGQQTEQLNYINANYGPPNNYIWGCGWAPYHNCDPVCTTGTVQQILDAMWANSNSSVAGKTLVINVANNWGLKSLCYEAGSDTGGGDTTNIANKIGAERASGMKDVYIHDLRDNWFPLGGDLVMYLAVSSGYNRYGSWGLTDDYHNPDRNYKFAAVRDLLGDVVGPPGQASNPSPANGATGVSTTADLSWTPGSGAASHDVYFGTASTPPFIQNQTGTIYDTGTLANSKTYYWRINEKNDYGTTDGVLWSFTTAAAVPPGQASNPSPANGATGVSTTADLSWTAGSGAASHDVYFGTTSPGTFQGNQTATTFDTGTMANSTTYYWRIDEKNAYGTTTGAIWSFTTATAAPVQLLAWDFVGEGGASSSTADVTAAHISTTAPSGVASIGPGLTPMDYCSNGLTAVDQTSLTLAAAIAGNEYFTWTITPESGYQMTLTSVDIRPVSQNRTRTFTLFSSVNGFTEGQQVGSFTESANLGAPIHTVTLTGHTALTGAVEFRLYVHGYDNVYESVGMGNGDGMDLVVNGTVGTGSPTPPAAPANLTAMPGDAQVDLDWDASTGADNYKVYRGTGGNYYWQASPTDTFWTDTSVTNGTTYWYYVTAENTAGESGQSNVVSATPQVSPPGQASNPSPANGTMGVSTTADLSWTAGAGATSHDVYFGTLTSPPFVVNQTGTTYDTGTMNAGTTYYWRINEKNAGGTTTGVVWSFTTAAAVTTPTFVAAGAVSSGTGAITPALPSGRATNDILLLFLETANQAISISNQNGGTWTAVTNSPQGTGTAGGSSATRLTVFWSRYNGTQGAPTTSDSGNHQIGRMIAVRGAITSGNPWDVTAGGVETTSDTSGSIPGATTTVANTLVVAAIATNLPDATGTANFSAWANSNLTNVTERIDNTRNSGNGGGLGIVTGVKATAGAYGNTTVTTASSAVKGMMSIAIKGG